MGDEGDVSAFAFQVRDAEWDDKIAIGRIRDFARITVKQGVFHEIHRIIVTNGGFDQTFDVGGGRR